MLLHNGKNELFWFAGKLKMLETLRVDDNHLTSLPTSVGGYVAIFVHLFPICSMLSLYEYAKMALGR